MEVGIHFDRSPGGKVASRPGLRFLLRKPVRCGYLRLRWSWSTAAKFGGTTNSMSRNNRGREAARKKRFEEHGDGTD